ncbi:MAG TPA: DUF1697 domain-containing protein [Gemmatimonadales bacterium]|nr:DUF1697 domain-containing protein [Gemmatimonadales bacterium]
MTGREDAGVTHVGLLRGVNVGGRKPVAMADLRALLADLGFADGRTLLQSGNVVFRGGARRGQSLERYLEAEAAARLRLRSDFFVRTAAEWRTIVSGNPFPETAMHDPGHLLLVCLKAAVSAATIAATQAAIAGPERIGGEGREVYVVYPDGVGTSRLTHAVLERRLGTRGTGRSWNTVRKLDALANG